MLNPHGFKHTVKTEQEARALTGVKPAPERELAGGAQAGAAQARAGIVNSRCSARGYAYPGCFD